jgi:flagellar assembly factor FliW
LAGRFIIADITQARSIAAELSEVVKDLESMPVQPLILNPDYEYALFEHIKMYPWVLDMYRHENQIELINSI